MAARPTATVHFLVLGGMTVSIRPEHIMKRMVAMAPAMMKPSIRM